MAVQKGIDLLLKLSSDGTSGGTMNTLGGIRSDSISFNGSPIDTTSADDTDRWRQLIAGGLRSFSVSGSGIFKDDVALGDAMDHVSGATETLAYIQVIIPNFRQVEGAFHISSLEFTGDHEGEATYSISLESAGTMTVSAI